MKIVPLALAPAISLIMSTAIPVAFATPLQAEDLPSDTLATYLKVLATSCGMGRICCSDTTMKAALESKGVSVDANAPIVFSNTPGQAKALGSMGRLIVSSRREMLGSASIVILEGGGKPKFFINSANLRKSHTQVSDAIMKISEKI